MIRSDHLAMFSAYAIVLIVRHIIGYLQALAGPCELVVYKALQRIYEVKVVFSRRASS